MGEPHRLTPTLWGGCSGCKVSPSIYQQARHRAPTQTALSYPAPQNSMLPQIRICPHWLFEAVPLQGGQLRALGHAEDTVQPGLGRQRQPGPSRGTAGPGCSWNRFLEFSFMSYSEDLGTVSKWIIPLRPLQALAAPAPKHVLSAGSGGGAGGVMWDRDQVSSRPWDWAFVLLRLHTSLPLKDPNP